VRQDLPGILIALGFFVVSLATLWDYGQTWDEAETIESSFLYLRIFRAFLTRAPVPAWEGHELPGYYFVFDVARGGFAWTLRQLQVLDDVLAFHLFHAFVSTIALFLFYRLAQNVSGERWIAALSTLALAFLPQFVAHSQNNPKDLPGLFVYVLAIYTFTRLGPTPRRRDAVYAGLALGLAFTTHVGALFLVPVLVFWQLLTHRLVRWQSQALVLGVAAITAFLTWPWLWSAPVTNAVWAARHIAAGLHNDSLRVLYLGDVHNAWQLPWHYTLVSFVIATPVLYLLFAGFSLARLRRSGEPSQDWADPRSAVVLGGLWCGLLIIAEGRAPMQYDGARHLLLIAPGFCLLVGVGLDSLVGWIEARPRVQRQARLRTTLAPASAILVFGYTGVLLARMHPYHNAYLNEAVNAWLPASAEDLFEVEYWLQSYKEGAEWLNTQAAPDADFYVGLDNRSANHYLTRPAKELTEQTLPAFEDQTRTAYLMVITRKAMYQPPLRHIVETCAPVFEIRRQKGTLLRICSNRQPS
jgi:4-amino-4-deoxy-L-arabinose transferase-like glycosyltransferase